MINLVFIEGVFLSGYSLIRHLMCWLACTMPHIIHMNVHSMEGMDICSVNLCISVDHMDVHVCRNNILICSVCNSNIEGGAWHKQTST